MDFSSAQCPPGKKRLFTLLSLEIRRFPDGETEDHTETSFTLSPGENILKAELTVPSPRLWSTEDSNLYSVRAELSSGKRSHIAAKKTGFRTFIVDGDGYFRLNRSADWLYHRETVLRPGGRFFSGMQTGAADALLYTGLVTGNHFDTENAQVPDETDAIAFSTGYPNDRGYIGGFKLGTYRLGAGELTLSTFDLLDPADSVPCAARLLVNLPENA